MGNKVKMKKRKANQGESFFILSTEYFKCAHCHALYLGPDQTGENKVLLATFSDGWAVVDLEGIEDAARLCGRFNIENELFDENGEIIGYEYAYYDKSKRFTIKVNKNSGIWKIASEFEMPSWSQ